MNEQPSTTAQEQPPNPAPPPAGQEFAVVPQPTTRAELAKIAVGERGIELKSFDDLFKFAQCVAKSEMAPKDMKNKPETVLVAVQFGLELGLSPMSALQNIAVVNGRPAIFGDSAPALVRSKGVLEQHEEFFTQGGTRIVGTPTAFPDDTTAVCLTLRKGDANPKVATFSVADAKRAGLWGKDGPWKNYPQRMLMWRARGFNYRDNFPDVLKGLLFVEEAGDIPTDGDGKKVTLNLGEALARRPGGAIADAEVSTEGAAASGSSGPAGIGAGSSGSESLDPLAGARGALIQLAEEMKCLDRDADGTVSIIPQAEGMCAIAGLKDGEFIPVQPLNLDQVNALSDQLKAIKAGREKAPKVAGKKGAPVQGDLAGGAA